MKQILRYFRDRLIKKCTESQALANMSISSKLNELSQYITDATKADDYAAQIKLFNLINGTYSYSNGQKFNSSVCRATDILRFSNWVDILRESFLIFLNKIRHVPIGETYIMHRKLWEYVYIVQALYERNLLMPGKYGLGFAVGQEPLPSLFASHGCKIMTSDLDPSLGQSEDWQQTNQHANGLDVLYNRNLCGKDVFDKNVKFEYIDMNNIPAKYDNTFDFCWSSCACEHLGSIKLGLEFIYKSLNCLKPGGIAVHTTEFNVLSNTETLEVENLVLFRKRDFEEIYNHLTAQGHFVEPLDFRFDGSCFDDLVCIAPTRYYKTPHLKFEVGGHVSTSIGIIVQKKN